MMTHNIYSIRRCLLIFISVLIMVYSNLSFAVQQTPMSNAGLQHNLIPTAPNIDAKGYVLEDVYSGKIIAEKNANKRMEPASLTKMMTLYLVFNALKKGQINLDDKVHISVKAWRMGGSKMFIREGQDVDINKLIEGVITVSGNDACIALAEYIAGSEDSFVNLMNQQAKLLGMQHTHFTDATGMPHANHYSTPADMAKLARALILTFPEYYHYFSQKSLTFANIKQYNRNRLLWRGINVDGLKTGHTKAAGYCLVSSAKNDNTRLLSVVMGAPSEAARANDSQALLTYGFRFFETHQLYQAQQIIKKVRVWQGQSKQIPVGLDKALYVTIPRGHYKTLTADLHTDSYIKAPVTKNQQLGTVNVYLKKKMISKVPVIALAEDPVGSFWRRMTDYIALSINKLFSSNKTA